MLKPTKQQQHLANQLWKLADLHEQCALQLNKLWWHIEQSYEKCLIDASVQTLHLHAEDIKHEAKILVPQVRKTSSVQTVFTPPSESLDHLLSSFFETVLRLNSSYSQLKQKPYSPLTLELLSKAAFEIKNISYILLVVLERLRYYKSTVSVSHALMNVVEQQLNHFQQLN